MMTHDACFACTTPYQVMGAIAITQKEKLDADLYIFGMFSDADEIGERIRKHGIFSNVYTISRKIAAPGRRKGFLQMLSAERTTASYLPADVSYRSFYSSSRAFPKVILHHVLQKRNPAIERIIFEDGMGTYSTDMSLLRASRLMNRAEKLLHWNFDDPEKTRMMAYLPRLVTVPAFIKGKTCEQMPRLELSGETGQMLEDIFGCKESSRIREKYIIFDTLRLGSFLTEEQYMVLDRCYEAVRTEAGDDVICKPHPRSLKRTSAGVKTYSGQSIPMEVLYAGMEDIERRILISYTSTAIFTPKILFGREPVVISLHRMLPDAQSSVIFEDIYEKFHNAYQAKERVMAPRSMEELKCCLDTAENSVKE